MSGLFSSLNTGYSGLKTNEVAMSVVSHNIANADNPYYTRQRSVIEAKIPYDSKSGQVGLGSEVSTIVRIHDEFTYARLKTSSGNLSFYNYQERTLEEVAKYFPDLDDVGLVNDMTNYFNSWNDLASNPDDASEKIALAQNSLTFVKNLSDAADRLDKLQRSINDELKIKVEEINRTGEQIAELNRQISEVESVDPNRANDLRDQRDKLELSLSKLLDISVFKGEIISDQSIDANLTDRGQEYYLNISGYSFVDGGTFHPIEVSNEYNNSHLYSIYHVSQDGSRVDITDKLKGGEVGAMLELRGGEIDPVTQKPSSGIIQDYINDLNSFAKTLIEQTNSIYAKSAQESMVSPVLQNYKDDTVLVDTDDNIKEGTFYVKVYDIDGNEVAKRAITIDSSTIMNDTTDTDPWSSNAIISQLRKNVDDNDDNNSLNDVDDYFDFNFSGNQLSFTPKDSSLGYTIAIDDIGTNLAGTLGMNRFFEGNLDEHKNYAQNIDLLDKFKNDPEQIQASSSPVEGNNEVANEMIQLQYDNLEFVKSNGSSVNETFEGFYRYLTTKIATDGESVNSYQDTAEALYNTVNTEYQSISGVNTDEELTNLIKYQTSYGANAKVISTIDQMLNTLLGIKQ